MLLLFCINAIYAQKKSAVAREEGTFDKKYIEAKKKAKAEADARTAAAKIADVKRRADLQAEGKRIAAENAKNNKERTVYYAPIKQGVKPMPPKSKEKISDKTVLVGAGEKFRSVGIGATRFLNKDGQIVLENSNWTGTYSFEEFSSYEDHKNWGVVRVSAPNDKRWDHEMLGQFNYAIVDSKGEYIYNDKNCRSLQYLKNGWLLISTFDNANAYLYNLKTKKKSLLASQAYELNEYTVGDISGEYVSITPSALALSELNYEARRKLSDGERIRDNFIENHIITEETLNKNMFTFVFAENGNGRKVNWRACQINFGVGRGGPTVQGVLEDYGLKSFIIYHVSPSGNVSKQIVN